MPASGPISRASAEASSLRRRSKAACISLRCASAVSTSAPTRSKALTEIVALEHDALTGLWNRRGFARHTEAIAADGPHALLYMDIDHFKIVNDRCGHEAGDSLLIEVANTLQTQ